jgi:anti-sigma factor RsiW
MSHVRNRIQALCDGQLSAREAEAVRDHCRRCEDCARALREAEAVWRLVDADPAPELPRPLWPDLARRLDARTRPRPSALGGWTFAGAAVAATIAGLVLGFYLGGRGAETGEKDWRSLLEEGAVIVDGAETTLDAIYLAADAGDGGDGS